MIKVKLKENIRYFDHDDSDFFIQGNEVKELAEKHLRSYSIKLFLFTGRLEVTEGEILFNYKSGKVFIKENLCYVKEFNSYFKKDLELDTMIVVQESEVPKDILKKLKEETSKVEEKKVEEKKVEPIKMEKPKIAEKPKEGLKLSDVERK